ncbi:MAG: hypothetical protein UV74_C0013G0457 [Candidatus Woesebacteria bacterium GW2011_GWB1_43_14]|uniref:Asl1-like glycosyl hydrolase catalytic domain-containing protein n=1 Tax=Candidatus Woesebacteria bacterium GW2011_GWB1_43_14 TaxID=1618578 RepID=A0A0G1DHJ2_9BACT|nr:MAG: hypothetical protein UT21_C0001G0169 [Candidatus Woesebacteria bacterium GW2011_GWA1_39_11b]KKS77485.1 MAG: hypothetical protein UV51_C0006G0002 [Candidatus Woesebacteria bacterium GW2011_GWC1_42_9]KKS97335.1 MAG: hypothetical protein UV74_C0013G0457 [Candidatus Woesebacteria bacterium GW2011_GWB1_43_14]
MIKKSLAVLVVLTVIFTSQVEAQTNNKFGIHIVSEADLIDASNLVGENGFVTMVIREDERDHTRWQGVFNEMKRLKLIPIIRIATRTEGDHWIKPNKNEAENWAKFLNSLDWPTNDRFVVLFNEPNHAKEWGGEINPQEYAEIARTYWEELKKASTDFFVLPAGLDLAANNSSTTMDAHDFYTLMHQSDELIFTIFDGLTSHSYPNPNYSGSQYDTGKMSIAGYKWELEHLKKYDLYPNIPVFITETGWINTNSDLSGKYLYAFNNVWSDSRIMAVTPFLLSYQSAPFDVFSWKDKTGNYLPHFQTIANLAKVDISETSN